LRAIKPPFTKRITISGRDESEPRNGVSNLLSFLAAIIAGDVNDFGADVVIARGPGWSGLDWESCAMLGDEALSVERFGVMAG
jgi:hypothetical protein